MANKLSDIDWFRWNGVKCTEYGMHVLEQPTLLRPKERMEFETVPGRSGSLTLTEGDDIFDDLQLTCKCVIDDSYGVEDGASFDRLARISAWLRGSGEVVFANRPEGFYKARISNQLRFETVLRGHPHRAFSVEFRCQPFFYQTSGLSPISVGSDPVLVTNTGNIASLPLIKLTGTGEGTLMIGNGTMLVNSFENIDYLMLDCEAKVAYKGAAGSATDPLVLLGSRVTGEWLTIPTGQSFITLVGGVTSASVVPRWRSI